MSGTTSWKLRGHVRESPQRVRRVSAACPAQRKSVTAQYAQAQGLDCGVARDLQPHGAHTFRLRTIGTCAFRICTFGGAPHHALAEEAREGRAGVAAAAGAELALELGKFAQRAVCEGQGSVSGGVSRGRKGQAVRRELLRRRAIVHGNDGCHGER